MKEQREEFVQQENAQVTGLATTNEEEGVPPQPSISPAQTDHQVTDEGNIKDDGDGSAINNNNKTNISEQESSETVNPALTEKDGTKDTPAYVEKTKDAEKETKTDNPVVGKVPSLDDAEKGIMAEKDAALLKKSALLHPIAPRSNEIPPSSEGMANPDVHSGATGAEPPRMEDWVSIPPPLNREQPLATRRHGAEPGAYAVQTIRHSFPNAGEGLPQETRDEAIASPQPPDSHSGLVAATEITSSRSFVFGYDAEEVNLFQLEQQARQEQKSRHSQRILYGILALSLVILVIGLGVGVAFRQKDSGKDVRNPMVLPTPMPSSAPTTALDLLLHDLPETSRENIYTSDTPQQQAFAWLTNHPNITNLPEWRTKQMFALATFYYAFEGSNWPQDLSSAWLDYTIEECYWINTPLEVMNALTVEYLQTTEYDLRQCNDAGEVQTIFLLHLQLSNVQASFPPELALLHSLTVLALMASGFQARLSDMAVPEFTTQLSNLEILSLVGDSLSGTIPTEIALFTAMRYLMLTDNQLSGTIPTELGTMSNLKQMYLSVNSVSGGIPRELGLLTSMTDLDLDINSLSGPIITELGMLSSLGALRLGQNSLSGTIPKQLTTLPLEWLVLDQNNLSGTIPFELGLMDELKYLYLHSNSLTGSIPQELELLLADRRASPVLDVSLFGNELVGTVPNKLCLLAEPVQSGPGLIFDCNEQLCGCWCACSGAADYVASNQTTR